MYENVQNKEGILESKTKIYTFPFFGGEVVLEFQTDGFFYFLIHNKGSIDKNGVDHFRIYFEVLSCSFLGETVVTLFGTRLFQVMNRKNILTFLCWDIENHCSNWEKAKRGEESLCK